MGERYTSTSGSVLQVVPMPEALITDMCDLTVGLQEHTSPLLRIVEHTLIAPGASIIISEGDFHAVEVFSQHGARMAGQVNTAVARSIPTAGWATGIYLVRALDRQGRPLGTVRVVVQ